MEPVDLAEKLERLPDRPGVYLYKDAKGQVVYVGKAASVRSRVRSYFQASRTRDAKTDALVDHIADLDYIVTANELEALILESNLVKRHRPRYNIILRDDKHYPFLKLTTNEEFPRLLVARRVQKDGATYYGPFYPATALRETLRLVRALFPLRTCSIKIDGAAERPCLQYYIHRCNAPCTGWETREGYDRTVKDVQAFLEGRDEDLARRLTAEMEEAAAQEKFERAGILRDQVQALNTVRERQKIISVEPEDQDILGLARQGPRRASRSSSCAAAACSAARRSSWTSSVSATDGELLSALLAQFYSKSVFPPREVLLSTEVPEETLLSEWLAQLREGRVELLVPQRGRKRELVAMAEENAALALQTHLLARSSRRQVVVEELRRELGLPEAPHRIEGFDISNMQGQEAVGSMVVWEAGGMKKDDYKRFKIRTVPGADDFAMMAEVLRRRYGKALEDGGTLPDLILLDGGRGQLSAGSRVLEELGLDYLPIVALAKRAEEVYHPGSLHPLVLDLASPALQTLQRVRDEAHRFAITYHKKLRQKRTLVSVLDQIPGVGPSIRTNLLKSLGSARRVRTASVAELASVPKVTPKLAQRIHDFFHREDAEPGSPAAAAAPAPEGGAGGPSLASDGDLC